MADEFRKEMLKRIGPGGTKCPCCNDYWGKKRSGLIRLARRGLKKESLKEIADMYNLESYFEEEDWKGWEYWEDWKDKSRT